VKIHIFESSAEAYDDSQCNEDIKDGDILHVPSEGVAAVLVEAWPTVDTQNELPEGCAFHSFGPGYTGATLEGGKYAASFAKAEELIKSTSKPAA